MLKQLLIALSSLALALTPAQAETSSTKAKLTEAPKKPGPQQTVPAKPSKKTKELSEADKALVAHAEKEATKLTGAQQSKLLQLVNTGKSEQIQAIPGVGEVKSTAIIKARPFKAVSDLIMVDGIGEVTFDGIVKWTRDGMKSEGATAPKTPAPVAEPAAKAKPAPKKSSNLKKDS